MFSGFTPECGYHNSTIIVIRDVYCPKTKCLGKLCLHKKTLQSLGTNDYQCPQCASVCEVRIIICEYQTNSFSWSTGQGFIFFKENPKSLQDVVGDVSCPGKYCVNREKCQSLDGYVTTPRPIFGCGKCGAWLFVHNDSFTLQEHVRTKKTDQTRFFYVKKKEERLTRQTVVFRSPISVSNIERKNRVWTAKNGRLFEICIVRHVEMESVFTFQSIKRLVSATVESAKQAWCHVLNFPFTDQKPSIILIGAGGTHCFSK